MKNKELARIFDRIADALEFKGEMIFRVLAYRKAARVLSDLVEDVEVLYREGKLDELPGIGAGIAKKVVEGHQGRIGVESAGPEKGSCFYFTLPYKPAGITENTLREIKG